MTEVLAVTRFTAVSGIPADATENTLAFNAADLAPATLNGIAASITSLFNTANAGGSALRFYLSGVLSRAANAVRTSFYDISANLDGSPHGSPVHVVDWTLGAAAPDAAYPSEVCIVLSFHGDLTGVPETAPPIPPSTKVRKLASRRKGRLYFGPLSEEAAFDKGPTVEPKPDAQFYLDVATAVFRFMDERPDFSVWSRVDEVLYPVAPLGGWSVDDALDTQRRRGRDALTRTVVWP